MAKAKKTLKLGRICLVCRSSLDAKALESGLSLKDAIEIVIYIHILNDGSLIG